MKGIELVKHVEAAMNGVRQGETGRKGLHGGRDCAPHRKVHTLSSEGKPRRFSKENERIIFLFLMLALLQCAG